MSDQQAPPAASPDAPSASAGGPPASPPITVYRARRPPKRRPLWVRIALWTLLALLVLGAAGAGGVLYLKVYEPLQNVTRLGDAGDVADLQHAQPQIDAPPPAGAPATALVIGYDHRAADGAGSASRSDTLMLVHVDPRRMTLTTLSIPRDTKAYIPGHGYGKINEAYTYGKAALAIETVKNFLPGVQINYVIAVNFHGFTQTVDAFGGVYQDIDRRYLNVNDGTADHDYAAIDLPPGYQLLDGKKALEYVRFRHNDSDVIRTVRQQAFVREFKPRIDARIKDAGTLLDLVDIFSKNIKIAGRTGHTPGWHTMGRYLQLLKDIPRDRMLQVHLNGQWLDPYIEVSPDAVTQAIHAFTAPDIAAAATVTKRDVGGAAVGPKRGTPSHQPLYVIPARQLKVWTLNGSAIDHQASDAATALREAGYPQATVGDLPGNADLGVSGNAWNQGFFVTKIYYANARAKGAARKLQGELSDADPLPFPAQLGRIKGQADVVIVTGQTYDGVHPPTDAPSVPAKTPPLVSPVPTTLRTTLKAMARRLHYPALVPTVAPTGSVFAEPVETTFKDPRVYRLNGQLAAHLTAYAGQQYDSTRYWGIQWSRWTTAPILQNPGAVRRVHSKSGSRIWKVYYNGAVIHRIAVFYGAHDRYVAWVDNSLTDGFSNSTMIAIAKGLEPVAP